MGRLGAMKMLPILIVNPSSANGSTLKKLHSIEKELRSSIGEYEIRKTTAQNEATVLTREALRQGHQWIVAVGGDGTINEVVNGFFDEEGTTIGEPILSLLPSGTGGDFRKTWHVGRTAKDALHRMVHGEPRWMDAGIVRWHDADGAPRHRYFANIATVGLGARVSDQANRQSKILGGKASFYVASLRALLGWSNIPVSVQVDEQERISCMATTIAMCNGQFFGGGMQCAPNADPSDGLFDVVFMTDLTRLEIARMTSIYKGQHLNHPKVRVTRGRTVTIRYEESAPSPLEAEGEVFGSLPATFELLPKAFQIKV